MSSYSFGVGFEPAGAHRSWAPLLWRLMRQAPAAIAAMRALAVPQIQRDRLAARPFGRMASIDWSAPALFRAVSPRAAHRLMSRIDWSADIVSAPKVARVLSVPLYRH